MAFPKFHGITLANNSWIENAHFERLAADPVPAAAGRVWFNTTEKKLKFSSLDASGAVVTYAFTNTVELAAALAEAKAYSDQIKQELLGGIPPETLDTITEIAGALQNNPDIVNVLKQFSTDAVEAAKQAIRGEVSGAFDTLEEIEVALNRIDGADTVEGSFRKAVLDEANARSSGDQNLQNQIGAPVSLTTDAKGNLVAAINELDAHVDAEVARATAAETALDDRVTTVEGQVNGKIGDLTTLHTDEKGTIVGALNEVQDELDAEVAARTSAVAAEKTRAEAAEAQLTTDLAAEVARATAAEQQLTSDLATEVAARTSAVAAEKTRAEAAEAQLTTDLAAEVARATAAEQAEAARAQSAEQTLTTNLAAEVSRAQAAEQTLTTNLAAEVSRAQAAEQAEATRAQSAEAQLTTDLAAEVSNRIAAVAAEKTRAETAESALQAAITAEANRAQGVEGSLTALTTTAKTSLVEAINELDSDLAAEVSARTAAVAAEKTRAEAAEAQLTSDLSAEAAARAAADSALKSAINGQHFTFTSPTAALSHVINHGLNSEHLLFSVLVEGADGKFRNDIVPVEEIDYNNFRIDLAEARRVKVSVKSMTALA
jgi:hypothetical protein